MSETIDDIVRDIRYFVAHVTATSRQFRRNMMVYADRIEAAYKSQLTDGTMCTMSCRTDGAMLEQYAASEKLLVAENARLRDALEKMDLRLRMSCLDGLKHEQIDWLAYTRKIALDALAGGAE